MQISNNFSVASAGLTSGASRSVDNTKIDIPAEVANLNPVDQIEFSAEAEAILSGETSSEFRADKVASIRQQIASGNYDTDEKLSLAFDRLLDSLG
jgi:anti-sigma28 factor (negative regulator of flagellin synthesis)